MNHLYRRLDALRAETRSLRDSYEVASDGTPGGRVQRDIAYNHHNATLTALTVAEDRLCFGRLDRRAAHEPDEAGPAGRSAVDSMHIGRLGLFDEGAEGRQILMDWRAPAARPFYVATATAPLDVVRRRHLRIRRRRVDAVSDEFLDLDPDLLADLGVDRAEATQSDVAGEAALLEALNAPRTGRMGDIVATIQAEQDAIIRADRTGVLVVQGGPGTGKTAVALHRAAYLLYTYREQLANRGVLLIGPNRTFLNYIGQVLPSLGENAVVLSTLGDLFPSVSATRVDDAEVAVLKGRLQMVGVIANAVLQRQGVPKEPVDVATEQGMLRLEPEVLRRAQARAWGSRLPHNRARTVFLRVVLTHLVRQVADRHRRGLGAALEMTAEDLDDIRTDLRSDEKLAVALAGLWPVISPTRLVADLLSSPRSLAFAAPDLSPGQRERLLREPTAPWTLSDVPLLDEAAELLGQAPVARTDRPDGGGSEFAQDVLDMLAEDDPDNDGRRAADSGDEALVGLVTASTLADLHQEDRIALTSTAERASTDREWTYGHVLVDEAQELSPMAWRMVMRRCPVRSMTLVGDVAQTSDAAGATNWERALRPHVGKNFRVHELTVNYRTPAEIAAVADRVLARIDRTRRPPRSIRSTGVQPWWRQVPDGELPEAALQTVRAELASGGQEHLAVIVAAARRAAIAAAVAAGLGQETGNLGTDLHERAVVLTVPEAKGLEFDVVVLVDPDGIENEHRHGRGDVYVALTRATQRLGVLYSGRRPRIAL